MTLPSVLDDVRRRFAPSYGDALTNHLPMAAIALDRLGASEARIRAFIEHNAASLEPARPWPAAAAVAVALRERGVDAVLRERLRVDMAGLAGGAFHGVIRLAWATVAKDTDELAHALAYLEETGRVLDVPVAREKGTSELGELVDELRAARIDKPTGPNITVRIDAVAADPRFQAIARRLVVDGSTLRQVSGFGARWYLAADDFPSLHVLTGAHAVRVLRPWTADQKSADRALALAALACFVVCGSPERADARNRERAEDKELKPAAIASDDDHMAKLVAAAIEEERAHEDAIYRIVATRAVRRGRT